MLCFSKSPDLLSQWRGYADNGKGVCIGFNRDYFEKTKRVNKDKEFEIYDILYKKGQQKKIINLYIKEHFFEKDIETLLINYRDMRFRIEAFKITKQLLDLGIQFKNPTFSEENEVRIVHGFPELAAEPDSFSYRFTDDNLISYVEIPLTHKKYYPVINEIILGPKCKIDLNQFKRFLGERIGLGLHKIEIKHSNCSFY